MRLAALLIVFVATPALADEISDAITVGRFDVMLDQAAAIERVKLPPMDPRDTLYSQLVATVERYNVLADRVCRKAKLPAGDCAGPFRPAWLAPGAGTDLGVMIEEAGARIGTFWGDVCARAPDRHFCDIE